MNKILVVGGTQGGIGSAVAERIEGLGLGEVVMPNEGCLPGEYRELNLLSKHSIESFCDAQGPFSHVVYTAARNRPAMATDQQLSDMLTDYHLNVAAFVYLSSWLKKTYPGELKSIVAISSDARRIAMRGSVSYCATKAALSQAVAVMAKEWMPEIRVNAVAPTSVEDTPMTRQVNKDFAAARNMSPGEALAYELKGLPMGRKVTKDEVAHTVLDVLFGPDYMNGTTVDITGGK